MKKNIWRLSTQPTVDEITTLLDKEVITKEEAKEILFRNEEELKVDQLKEIKEEIKFLRDMVLQLSKKDPEVVYRDIYKYIEGHPTYPKPYWKEWYTLCSNTAKSVGDTVTYNAMSSFTNGTNSKLTNSTIKLKD